MRLRGDLQLVFAGNTPQRGPPSGPPKCHPMALASMVRSIQSMGQAFLIDIVCNTWTLLYSDWTIIMMFNHRNGPLLTLSIFLNVPLGDHEVGRNRKIECLGHRSFVVTLIKINWHRKMPTGYFDLTNLDSVRFYNDSMSRLARDSRPKLVARHWSAERILNLRFESWPRGSRLRRVATTWGHY